MKIAIISDLHGNHYALEEVLKEARIEKIEKILVLGDIVGYFYNPDKIFEPASIISGLSVVSRIVTQGFLK